MGFSSPFLQAGSHYLLIHYDVPQLLDEWVRPVRQVMGSGQIARARHCLSKCQFLFASQKQNQIS